MLTSLTYANADGTRTAIVERCDSGDALFLWSVTCRDYGQSDHCLTGYLHFCQRIARRWVQQGHPPAGAAPGGRAVSPAQGGRTMMTEQRLQEIERRSTQGWRADWTETLEAVAEIRRLRAEVEQAQQERDAARETVTAVMVRLVPVVSDAAIVGKTYGHYDVVGIVEQAVADLAAAKADVAQPPALPPTNAERFGQRMAATMAAEHGHAPLVEPALPPLPEGWEEEHDGAVVRFTTQSRNTEMGVVADRYDVRFITPWRMVPKINVADLLIVLRHAEAAHLKLKGGAK